MYCAVRYTKRTALMSAGSKADIAPDQLNVRFTPKSGTLVERVGMSALCQKRTHAVQQLGYACSWIKNKNTSRIVERPRLEACKKRLTK